MRFKNNIIVIILLCFFLKVSAQEEINSALVEQKSYQMYLDKNWTDLITFGNTAVKQGYNYFYLQMRIGIAYFEKENYCLAESHFKQALVFNSDDELAQEYLYYCYIYTGRNEDARALSTKFSKSLSEKIGTNKQTPINFILIEAGTKITDSSYYYDVAKKGSLNYFDPALYFQLGIGHSIKNKVDLFHALTFFSQKNFVGSLRQIQYYLKAAVPLKHNWLISPSFHYINVNFTSEATVGPPPPPGGQRPVTQTTVSSSNYIVGSFAVQKTIDKFVFSIGNTFSNMSSKNQFIHSGFVSYSVFGNSKLVAGCTGYLHTTDSYSTTYFSAAPFIYVRPIKNGSIKASYFVNSGSNIIEDNGYLVNNSPDLTNSRWAVLANYEVNPHFALYGLYQLEFKKENVQLFNYRYNVLVAGVKITP